MDTVKLVLLAMWTAAGTSVGCRCSSTSSADAGADLLGPASQVTDRVVAVDLLDRLPACVVFHRGVLLDMGASVSDDRYGFSLAPPPGVENVDREGATWARVSARSITQRFVMDEDSPVFVQMRVRPGASRAVGITIDDRPLATVRLPHDETTVVETPATANPIAAGGHLLGLHFRGARKGQVAADIDWIRVGIPDKDASTYAAPTYRDLVIDTTLRGHPRRAIALRAPGAVRCQIPVPEKAVLLGQIGLAGNGDGEAVILVHQPGLPPAVVQTAKVGGESDATLDVEVPFDRFAGQVVDLELRAKSSTPGDRVVFAEPSLQVPKAALPPRDPVQIAIVVILSSTPPALLPPYRDVPALATLTDLAATSAAFARHRTTSTLAGASVASLLTGLPPAAHRLVDGGARLSERIPTLGTLARDGRVTTAMFTGNPTTFQAFGFDRGWDRFEAFSPVSGASARAPLDEATRWIEDRLQDSRDGRLLVVVHARGVHPPWSATAEETRNLPPEEYNGPIDARRGAQVLASARSKNNPHLKPADRQRIDGFCSLALVGEDQSLSQLIAMLRRVRVWNKTMLVVTSDVAMGAASRVPFGEGVDLAEDVLDLPLVIHFPGDRHGGKVVPTPTGPGDVLTTVLEALQLRAPDSVLGRDLFVVATHPGLFPPVAQVAEAGAAYATRLGDLLLRGTSPQPPALCALNAVGECGDDLTASRPFLDMFLFQSTFDHFRRASRMFNPPLVRDPATLDPDTVAALTVWGNLESR